MEAADLRNKILDDLDTSLDGDYDSEVVNSYELERLGYASMLVTIDGVTFVVTVAKI